MNILVLNAGSSSQKVSLHSLPEEPVEQPIEQPVDTPQPLWEGGIDFGHTEGKFEIKIKTAAGQSVQEVLALDDLSEDIPDEALALWSRDRAAATQHLLKQLWQGSTQVIADPSEIHAIGHRVVHGGETYRTATLIDETVKAAIRELIPLAPAHNPVNLAGIAIAQHLFNNPFGQQIPQFAVFDTAFHSTLPAAAAFYPVPQSWIQQGIRRYGFHGISHQYCAHRAAQLMGRSLSDLRLVIAHLGNGCSLSAIQGGHSIDTTMGFTPLDGLMMGTRSGSVDPGILTYLMRTQGYSHEQLDQQLNKESGLKGVSELSSDMREIVAAMHSGHVKAKLAFDIYIHRLRAGIAAMTASLGGLDALVFTAGVGEHATIVRAEACEGLRFLGIEISEQKNRHSSGEGRDYSISSSAAALPVWVIYTQEDFQIAQAYWNLS